MRVWHVIDNDLTGGWCVGDLDLPLSQWDFRGKLEKLNSDIPEGPCGKLIADCISKEDAERIAYLLNLEEQDIERERTSV